ncbi:MAG: hypothetical protein H6Q70_125 [Firmicutes bacterium]|nr:hypothetical protein [Bacillota bacterium]
MDKYNSVVEMWKSYKISKISDTDKYLDNFRVLFAFHSGKIENEEITYHDTREIFENGQVLNYTGNPRALFEQQNQKLCYEFLKDKIVTKKSMDVELIKEIHKILTSGTYDERRFIQNGERPGEFKKHDYVVGLSEVGTASENVEKELTELILEVNEVNSYKNADVLKVAAYFHAKFEYIHPFADGNGRTGRTLLNYYLMTNDHPPLIIYNEDKKIYYECLQKYDEFEELNSLVKFLKYETEKTWEKTLVLSGQKIKKRGSKDREGQENSDERSI